MRGTVAADVHGGVHIVHFYMGDSDDEFACNGSVRTVATCSDEESEHVHTILLESGADASIFPISLLGKGQPARGVVGRLHDAQGREIPVEAVQDMQIRLRDISGKSVLLTERVAVSSMVHQPILCFGRLLENGWSVDGTHDSWCRCPHSN